MKAVIAGLTLTLIWGSTQGEASREQIRPRMVYASAEGDANRAEQCRFQWLDPGRWTAREERRTAWCVEHRWPIPGGVTKLDAVIDCESGWSRFAFNPLGPYVGLAQHALVSWPWRVASYQPAHWILRPGWRNSRSQIVVTVRMVRAEGWAPWSCA